LKVYNLLGQEVAALVDGQQTAGQHSVVFDASRLSSGAYFVQIRAGSFNKSMKILLLK